MKGCNPIRFDVNQRLRKQGGNEIRPKSGTSIKNITINILTASVGVFFNLLLSTFIVDL